MTKKYYKLTEEDFRKFINRLKTNAKIQSNPRNWTCKLSIADRCVEISKAIQWPRKRQQDKIFGEDWIVGKGTHKHSKDNSKERKKGRFTCSVHNICSGCKKDLRAKDIPSHRCLKKWKY